MDAWIRAGGLLMPRFDCLTAAELSAFHLGNLPEPALEELAEHLERCPRCEAAARALDGLSDATIAAYRQSARANPPASTARPERVGDYEILEEVGRGGMGVVYRARHRKLQRIVALKMLLRDTFADRHHRARFHIEAQAVARLHHPNIVQIYDIGEHASEGGLSRPYFTLEFVDGGNLAGRVAGRPQAPDRAAAWVEALAHAAHYGHQQGIIHRDLKPSNVLLTADGQPKICDFGVAKLVVSSSGQTRSGMLLGTVEYMAPEQGFAAAAVGPSADVYSLGAVLYTAITGRPPFQGRNALQILDQVRALDPLPPRTLVPSIPRDLETICLKCLAKDPARRYSTAEALANDLHRFRTGEPIQARPASARERAWKWARRRPGIALLSAAVVAVAALGFGLVAWQWQRAEEKAAAAATAQQLAEVEEHREIEARQETERLLAGAVLNHGVALCEAGEMDRGLLWLVHALELADRSRDPDLERVVRSNLAAWKDYLVCQRTALWHGGWVWAVAFSRDGRTVVTGSSDCTARLWDAATGQPRSPPLTQAGPVWSVAMSPDQKWVLVGSGAYDNRHGEARLWDASTGQPARRPGDAAALPPLPHPARVHSVAFSADGRTFLTVCSQEARLWRTADARPVGLPLRHPRPESTAPGVVARMSAAFSPDGSLVATAAEDGSVRLWDVATGKSRGEPLRASGPVLSLAFNPDGTLLLTGGLDGVAQMWATGTGRRHGPALKNLGPVKATSFSPDGRLAATGGAVEEADPELGAERFPRGEVRLWRTATGRPFGTPLAHPGPVWSLAFSPGGRLLLTGSEDAASRLFLVATGTRLGRTLPGEGTVTAVAFSPDGAAALTASAGGDNRAAARIWDLPSEQSLAKPLVQEGTILSLAFRPDGRGLLAGSSDHAARLWDLAPAKLPDPVALPHEGKVMAVGFAPDGRTFFTACENDLISTHSSGVLRIWEGVPPRPRHRIDHAGLPTSGDFSPDGRIVAIGINGAIARLWDAATGKPLGESLRESGPVSSVAFSPQGRLVATGTNHGVKFWDAQTGRLSWSWPSPTGWAQVAFYPNGKEALLVAGGVPHDLDLATRQTRSPPFHPDGKLGTMALSPDGTHILTAGTDRIVRLWDVATGKTLGPPRGAGARAVAFSPDGRRLAVGAQDGQIALWDAPPPPLEGSVARVRLWVETRTELELDPQGVVRKLDADALRQRQQQLRDLERPLAENGER
jgi:WD40 repeat protein/tRNA A-37 threonylcarbamoyl transferase component Bud32